MTAIQYRPCTPRGFRSDRLTGQPLHIKETR